MMDIKMLNSKSLTIESDTQKSGLRRLLPTVFLLSAAFLILSAFAVTDYKGRFLRLSSVEDAAVQKSTSRICEDQHRPHRAETLPKGIVSATSDLEMRPLWGHHNKDANKTINLLAMAVGMKQKENVDKIVKKFVSNDFLVMLFHYDGIVDPWNFEWSQRAIHVSAVNQTKWWFAKRFLHPDIVDEYAYIFLWDEDLGVDEFHVGRYLSIIKEEGLEISQPALDPHRSEVHHSLTKRNPSSRVHRKISSTRCDQSSTGPPCAGFVEMMAPVFSKASWRCAWHMIQNDLVHGWGLDFQLGYCAQGDRTKNVGIVDSEYIVHYALPTLGGGSAADKGKSLSNHTSDRTEVIKWSYIELEMFNNRWKKAAKDDECWTDQY